MEELKALLQEAIAESRRNWESGRDAWGKVDEWITEHESELASPDREIAREIGDRLRNGLSCMFADSDGGPEAEQAAESAVLAMAVWVEGSILPRL